MPFCSYRETGMVLIWNKNYDALDADRLIETSKKETVVALVMGCTLLKQECMLMVMCLCCHYWNDSSPVCRLWL